MIKCKRCLSTGAIFRTEEEIFSDADPNNVGVIKIGGTDACPRCSAIAEVEYDYYVNLRIQHGMQP